MYIQASETTQTRSAKSKRITIAVLGLIMGLFVLQMVDARYPWLWSYVADSLRPRPHHLTDKPIHVLYSIVDHFEPHDQETMSRWVQGYTEMASQHRDAFGRKPQHSWFWYFSQSDERESLAFLQQLGELAYNGFGEVELHYHHYDQTVESFMQGIQKNLRLSHQTGAMLTAEPVPRRAFGFVHGMWALDNSRGGQICGINNEISILHELGCYADFTHPSWGVMHPRTVNRFYYVTDDPERPKSYNSGAQMRVGGATAGDLLLMLGPSVVHFRGLRPVYDHGDVTMVDKPTPERIDAWINTGIHVKGRPEWLFVRSFTHGAVARDHDALLGEWAHRKHQYLNERYNDGTRYILHYVTAREAYNIAKAAEAGLEGCPSEYRNFLVPPPINRSLWISAPYEIISFEDDRTVLRLQAELGNPVTVRMRAREVRATGDLQVHARFADESQTEISGSVLGHDSIELHHEGLFEIQ